jgi:hypothetical protein
MAPEKKTLFAIVAFGAVLAAPSFARQPQARIATRATATPSLLKWISTSSSSTVTQSLRLRQRPSIEIGLPFAACSRPAMNGSVIVWDLETVPDLRGFAAANDLVGKTDEEIREAIGDKFPKHLYHSIVCIGALVAREEADHWVVDALGAPHVGERTEKQLIIPNIANCDLACGHSIVVIVALSSSNVMNMTPLADPGIWRTRITPAMEVRRPLGASRRAEQGAKLR